MSHDNPSNKRTPIQILFEYSLFLIVGAGAALVWANVDYESHDHFFHQDLFNMVEEVAHLGDEEESSHDESEGASAVADDESEGQESAAHDEDEHAEDEHGEEAHGTAGDSAAHGDGDDHGGGHHAFNLYFIINDVLMAFFFAIAGKEVWESLLPGGALSNPRKAATPLLATFGGIVGPALVYVAGVFLFSDWETLGRGWAIPCATDIAFSYLVARIIFGNGHPAIAFLLLLAIADDAAGLVIIAVFYPQQAIQYWWFGLTVVSMVLCYLFHKQFRIHTFWAYLAIPGVLCWFSFYKAGIHPALGLVPIIPFMPHAKSDLGVFAREEWDAHDTLNEFEHWWKNPVEIFLGLFGLCNAGVAFSNVGTATWLVLAGLIIGKPLGISLMTLLAEKGLKLEIPKGMGHREVLTLGCIAGIGFTVALFVSSSAFTKADGPVLDSAKMGALASFGAAIVSIVVAKVLGVKQWNSESAQEA